MSPTTLTALKIACACAYLVTVVAGVALTSRQRRLRLLRLALLPTFVATWGVGWLMIKATGLSMGESWVSATMMTGLAGLVGSWQLAHHAHPRWWWSALALSGPALGFSIMVGRHHPPLDLGVGIGVTTALCALLGYALHTQTDATPQRLARDVGDVFAWVARAEGVSLIVLFFVFMPLKYGLHIEIDGGTGLIGWLHGVLLLVYLIALGTTSRVLGWGWMEVLIGFVASLLPGGTFLFERRHLA